MKEKKNKKVNKIENKNKSLITEKEMPVKVKKERKKIQKKNSDVKEKVKQLTVPQIIEEKKKKSRKVPIKKKESSILKVVEKKKEKKTVKTHPASEALPVKEKEEEKKPAIETVEKKEEIIIKKPELSEQVISLEKKEDDKKIPLKEIERPKIKINELTTVKELSEKMNVPIAELIKKMMSLGTHATINQRIDFETAELIAHEFGMNVEFVPLYSDSELQEVKEGEIVSRAPVVTVMGHVDHGKTTLLDTIRNTNVTSSEFGGITQHIAAYKVHSNKGDIVFIDTPGHELFTAMRAHGAKVTDIVVLVVAADDGVMPQTVEAINHARSAGVPIIVAINKIDIPGANPEKVKQQLANLNLIPDSWGGDTLMVEISARNKVNIDKLIEAILFKSELMELKTVINVPAQGTVIEANMDPKKGPVGTVLIQRGILRTGDAFVCGLVYGKVKTMITDTNQRVNDAGPSTPVNVLGFESVPEAGDKLIVVKDIFIAREIIEKRKNIIKTTKATPKRGMRLEELNTAKVKKLNLILKTDVSGSLVAIRDALGKLEYEGLSINIIHGGIGMVTVSDVNLAISTDSIIIAFNVETEANACVLARTHGVEIRDYKIIYELLEDIKKAMEGLLEPRYTDVNIGKVQVKKIFKISNVGVVAGCLVIDGVVQSDAKVKIIRDGKVIFETKISTLKRFKDDVKKVEKGYECGITLANFNDIKVGDIFEVFIQQKTDSKIK